MKLSPWQTTALRLLAIPNYGHTCTIIGAALTGRKSAFGHQISAREGGRTLRSLERRGLVTYRESDDGIHHEWILTPKGMTLSIDIGRSAMNTEAAKIVA